MTDAEKSEENRLYFDFYLMGRDEAQDDFEDREIAQIPAAVARVIGEEESIRSVSYGIAEAIARTELEGNGKSVEWRKSSRKLRRAIDDAGGDITRAYTLYCAGYRDELASQIENEILNAIDEDDDADTGEDAGDDESVASDST